MHVSRWDLGFRHHVTSRTHGIWEKTMRIGTTVAARRFATINQPALLRPAVLGTAVAATLVSSTGLAATGTWIGTTDANWGTATNWVGGIPNATADDAIFYDAGTNT